MDSPPPHRPRNPRALFLLYLKHLSPFTISSSFCLPLPRDKKPDLMSLRRSPTYMGLVTTTTTDFLISVHPETLEDTCGEWKRFDRIKIWLLLMSTSLLTTNKRK
ncbi:unnamed protein product [Lactuca saligna]|uniref:Uncharacterized protein n=1 Tax=Lactuca saligna TaxID=75948 RepID=A0AA35ZVT3_LACSI|nr:unnamed protein product [Lactuca saligna]